MLNTEPNQYQPDPTPLIAVLVTLISLNLHGLIWVFRPVIPVNTKPNSELRTVKLVTLTPNQMRRLPEFSRPVATLPILPPKPNEPAKSFVPLPEPPSRPRSSAKVPANITPNPAPTPVPTPTVSFKESLRKFNAGYDPSEVTNEAEREKLSAWLKKARRVTKSFVPRPPIPHSIKSPIDEKLSNVTPVNVVVLVDPKGKPRGEPEVIRSSGYSKIDAAAIEDIKKRSFTGTGEYVMYQYRVEIAPNNPSPEAQTEPNSWTFPRPQ